jgi:dihydrofolate reductase
MRSIVVHMQTTLDGRIAGADGQFWEPFPWGEPESAYVNEFFRRADTWAMSSVMYDAIVPWWETVAGGDIPADVNELGPADLEFARLLAGMRKVVFSRSRPGALSGDLAAGLRALDGRIVLSAGPATLGPLLDADGLVDELLLAVHPVVLGEGPGLFDHATAARGLRLLASRRFDGGAVVLRYGVGTGAPR